MLNSDAGERLRTSLGELQNPYSAVRIRSSPPLSSSGPPNPSAWRLQSAQSAAWRLQPAYWSPSGAEIPSYSSGECYVIGPCRGREKWADSGEPELVDAGKGDLEGGFEPDFVTAEPPTGFLTRRVVMPASIALVPGVQGKNHRPRRSPTGPRIQLRISTVLAGSAVARSAACLATAPRCVVESGRTTTVPSSSARFDRRTTSCRLARMGNRHGCGITLRA